MAAGAVAGAFLAAFVGVRAFSTTTAAFSFQAAYDAAAPGAVIPVPAGQIAVDWAQAGSATIIYGGTKQVTFECADPAGLVTFDPANPQLLIANVSNVSIRGRCFRFRNVQVGFGDSLATTTSGIVLDGIDPETGSSLEGLEISGAEATIRNMRFGPSTLCYAQGRTGTGMNGGVITSAMWCDPANPVEAPYALVGNDGRIDNEFYIHSNSGGVISKVLIENVRQREIQSKDSFNMHVGCALIWQAGGAANQVVIRNSRFERCAVQGFLMHDVDNVVFENNWVGPVYEPFSNTGGAWVLAPTWAKELAARGPEPNSNWIVKGNTFCNGTRSQAPISNILFDTNDLGPNDAPWGAGATYANNTNVGASCSGSPPPPPPPPPPPVDTPPSEPGNLRVSGWGFTTSRCSSVSISWAAASDDKGVSAYRVYRDGALQTTLPASTLSYTRSTNCLPHELRVEAVDTIGQTASASLVHEPVQSAR